MFYFSTLLKPQIRQKPLSYYDKSIKFSNKYKSSEFKSSLCCNIKSFALFKRDLMYLKGKKKRFKEFSRDFFCIRKRKKEWKLLLVFNIIVWNVLKENTLGFSSIEINIRKVQKCVYCIEINTSLKRGFEIAFFCYLHTF